MYPNLAPGRENQAIIFCRACSFVMLAPLFHWGASWRYTSLRPYACAQYP
jgi:hypothetical protein